MRRVMVKASFPYGRQRIGKARSSTGIYGKLVGGPENPDGRKARDIGVRIRRRGRR